MVWKSFSFCPNELVYSYLLWNIVALLWLVVILTQKLVQCLTAWTSSFQIAQWKMACFVLYNDSVQSVFLLFCPFNHIAYKVFLFQGEHRKPIKSFLVILKTIVNLEVRCLEIMSASMHFTFSVQSALELQSHSLTIFVFAEHWTNMTDDLLHLLKCAVYKMQCSDAK